MPIHSLLSTRKKGNGLNFQNFCSIPSFLRCPHSAPPCHTTPDPRCRFRPSASRPRNGKALKTPGWRVCLAVVPMFGGQGLNQQTWDIVGLMGRDWRCNGDIMILHGMIGTLRSLQFHQAGLAAGKSWSYMEVYSWGSHRTTWRVQVPCSAPNLYTNMAGKWMFVWMPNMQDPRHMRW
jgi:hypothetical protein